jgi:TetR/AcrR family transcriptional repressor of nem operon
VPAFFTHRWWFDDSQDGCLPGQAGSLSSDWRWVASTRRDFLWAQKKVLRLLDDWSNYALFPMRPAAISTKERILDAAEELMLAKSFHSVGLNEILSAVRVPKGSFYHYFESKEQFGVELIRHYVSEHTARLKKLFGTSGTPALEKFADYWAAAIGWAAEGECQQCCLVAKLGLEVTSFSEPMRKVLADGLQTWRAIYAQAIREGQRDGSIRPELDPVESAAIIQDTWQGAMQRMQAEKSVQSLRGAARFLQGWLKNTTAAPKPKSARREQARRPVH